MNYGLSARRANPPAGRTGFPNGKFGLKFSFRSDKIEDYYRLYYYFIQSFSKLLLEYAEKKNT